ncbi:kelch-like protein 1 [Biomphalaria glabrata]|uniref:BTB domain-containing protein n=1 Tax=Biomphalaria glabrata TaxID=6526 RepID=A0A2C9M7A1_BIOGL|nr:kelch-like protein 1 [Biomphalaria glabrata]KAI8779151.1 kelch protein 1 [Biomphalaria glabrata]
MTEHDQLDPLEDENSEVASDSSRPQKLLEVASHCLKTGLYTDVTFIVGERKFPAHRLVMDSISDYFKSLFKIDENDIGEVSLSSVSPEDFGIILNFAYTGELNINEDNVQNILIAADFFQVKFVKDKCIHFIESHLEVDNVCDVILFARTFLLSDLEEKTVKFLKENLDSVSRNKRFPALDPDLLIQLIQDDNLILWSNKVLLKSMARERLVLNAVLRYMSARKELDDNYLEMLMCSVRLPELPLSVIEDCLLNFDCIRDNNVIQRVIKLREKAVRYLNKKARDNFQLTDLSINVSNVPENWFRARHLPNYIISTGRRRHAAGGEVGRCTGLPISSISDPNSEIHRIDIWVRQWDGHSVVGGLKLSYRNSGGYKECSRGDCHSLTEHYFVELEPEEFIIKVVVGSGYLIDRLGFETNLGRVCGPFGGIGGGKNTEKAPDGSFSYLFDINCDSVTAQGSDAIHNLILRWITFQ